MQTVLDYNEARDNGVAVKSAGAYANHLHLATDSQHLIAHARFSS